MEQQNKDPFVKLCLELKGPNMRPIMISVRSAQKLPLKKLIFRSTLESTIPTIFANSSIFKDAAPSLEYLCMEESAVCSVGAHIIATLIVNSNLIELNLCNCNMGARPLFIIMDAVKQSTVRNLTMCKIRIEETVTVALIDCTKQSSLVKLSLFNCTFSISASIVPIIDAIKYSHLRSLILVGDSLGNAEVAAISDCLQNSSLTQLKLVACSIPNDDASLIMQSITKSRLQCLSMSCMRITTATNAALCYTLEHYPLVKLCLSNCSFEDGNASAIIKSISGSQLKTLDMSCMVTRGDDDPTVITMCHLLENYPLIKLSLRTSTLSCSNLNAIMKSAEQSQLQMLNLSGVHIDETLTLALCSLLENSLMEKIVLKGCNLTDLMMVKICAAIKRAPRSALTSLNLSTNKIDREGILAICDLLKDCKLKQLGLSNSALADRAVHALSRSIKESSLIKLNINHNRGVSIDAHNKITACIQKNIKRNYPETKSARFVP